MLVSTDESKGTLQKYEKLWNQIRSITNNSDNYNENYIKIKFISDDGLPLKKMLELYNMKIIVRSVFHEGNNYYPQVF